LHLVDFAPEFPVEVAPKPGNLLAESLQPVPVLARVLKSVRHFQPLSVPIVMIFELGILVVVEARFILRRTHLLFPGIHRAILVFLTEMGQFGFNGIPG
jgi:hypothetical protein